MSDVSNDAITILKEQIAGLTHQLQALTSERDEYRDALDEISTERDTLKKQIADPGDVAKENAALKQSLRDRAHYDKFAELAEADGAKKAALKHLWKLADFRAEKDDIDEAKLTDLLKTLKAEAEYAFDQPADESAAGAAAAVAKARSGLELRNTPQPAAGGRSGRNSGQDGTIITAEMRADPKFMLNPANRELIADAAKNHRFR